MGLAGRIVRRGGVVAIAKKMKEYVAGFVDLHVTIFTVQGYSI
jgi:hypothetical protein